jgi:hypothetical protein
MSPRTRAHWRAGEEGLSLLSMAKPLASRLSVSSVATAAGGRGGGASERWTTSVCPFVGDGGGVSNERSNKS